MKKQFAWYLPPSEEEFNAIWEKAILTLDANVLLDLYRVHSETKNTLIEAISAFSGRIWLSNQAATEFIRNINKVKSESKKIFSDIKAISEDLTRNINSATNSIIGKKVLNKNKVAEFEEKAKNLLKDLNFHINESEAKHLEELKTDSILNWVSDSFDESVGMPIPSDEIESWNIEARDRIEKEIPPGYMDKNKDDERGYGDIFLWKQVLVKARESSSPIILVTSEKKEDWWEKYSGEISGQRQEMLKEAHDFCGQKIIILRTERFIGMSAERKGTGEIDPQTAAAIDDFISLRDENRLVNISDQIVNAASEIENKGLLAVELARPARYFTGSGHLRPMMAYAPNIEASLSAAPVGVPQYRLKAATGTRYDFNIHAKCVGPTPFPAGTYVFEYRASCECNIFKSTDVFPLDDVMSVPPSQESVTPEDNGPQKIATEGQQG